LGFFTITGKTGTFKNEDTQKYRNHLLAFIVDVEDLNPGDFFVEHLINYPAITCPNNEQDYFSWKPSPNFSHDYGNTVDNYAFVEFTVLYAYF
jgi:hypothetical protein